jgi:hypothetical protein
LATIALASCNLNPANLENATATAQAAETAAAHGTATARAASLATSRVARTAEAQISASATARVISNITATADTANSRLSSELDYAQVVWGPASGRLWHNHSDEYLVHRMGLVLLSDFIVECEFQNPYLASWNHWDIGYGFRFASWDMFYVLIVRSDSRWVLIRREGSSDLKVAEGLVSGLRTGEGEWNQLQLMAVGDAGYVYINGVFVAELDLSDLHAGGELFAGVGISPGTEVGGYYTDYRNFRVWRLSQ